MASPPSSPYRIGILECDTPVPNVIAHQGTYGDIFKRFIERGHEQNDVAKAVPYTAVACHVIESQEYPDLDTVDALFLTGSKHDSFADEPWILSLLVYVREAYARGKRLVGICFGHQIICRALGGDVRRSPGGWEVSVCEFGLSDAGRQLFGGRAELRLHQMHRDAVLALPEGFQNLGRSDRCGVQGSYVPGKVFTVQAHPEFNDYIMSEILKLRHAQGVFDDALYEDAAARSAGEHDGNLVSAAIWKFLLQPSS